MSNDRFSLDDPDLHLQGRFFTTQAPVQADGDVAGWPFYFRSRGRHWTFGIKTRDDIDPVDICLTDVGFYREGTYGEGEFDASYMPLDQARKIIRRCCREFLATVGSG